MPKDLHDSRESHPIDKEGDTSSNSSLVEMLMIESRTLLNTLLQIQDLAIASTTNTMNLYPSIQRILERDLQVKLGEASIWG